MTDTKKKAAESALADARAKLRDKRKELAEAQALVTKIGKAWDRGAEDYSGADKVAADAEVERLTKATNLASQHVKYAEGRVRALNPALAERAALAIGDTIFGVEAKAVLSRPTGPTKDVQVSVIETRQHESVDSYSGGIRGGFDVIVTGPEFLGEFDGAEVGRALGKGGVNLGHGHHHFRVTKQAPGVFSASYHAEFAMPLDPVVSVVPDAHVRAMFGSEHVRVLAERHRAPSLTTPELLRGRAGTSKVSERIEGGVRTVEADAWLTAWSVRPGTSNVVVASIVEDHMRDVLKPRTGFAGVGVVEDVTFSSKPVSFDGPHGHPIAANQITARVVLKSKVPA